MSNYYIVTYQDVNGAIIRNSVKANSPEEVRREWRKYAEFISVEVEISEYEQQAIEFLEAANAEMFIKFGGTTKNELWDEKENRNFYHVTIKTPRGEMALKFWDSLNNTEKCNLSFENYCAKFHHCYSNAMNLKEKIDAKRGYKLYKFQHMPKEYDILACLTKYDPGTFEDFCFEYGYDTDSRRAEIIYFLCQKEYKDLSRIFTAEQLEQLAEIN